MNESNLLVVYLYVVIPMGPSVLNHQICIFRKAGFFRPLAKSSETISKGLCAKKSNYELPGLLSLGLKGREERRASKQRDEFPSPHSITSSALTSSVFGTVSPSALA